MLFCEDHRDRGELVAATLVSITGNRPYCDECWVEAPWAAKAAGFMPLGGNNPVTAETQGKAGEHSSPLQGKGETNMKSGHARKRIEIDEARLRDLHAKGMNDREMGKALGCSGNTVRTHRLSLGLSANGRGHDRSSGHVTRAAVASAGKEFNRHPQARARAKAIGSSSNGNAVLVSVRVELLDAMWAALEPEEKARLVNRSIETR